MFNFEHPEYLLVLAAVPLFIILYLLSLVRKRKIANKLGDPLLVKQLTREYHPGKFALKFVLAVLAFTAIAIGFANIRSATEAENVKRNGIDIMIALDVSNSMLAEDISPSRLDRAKQVISRIIDKLENDRVGIVIFAGKAYLQMPLTADHGSAKLYLSSASTESVPTQGTVIGEALKMCALSFNSKEKKYKSVILLSDGEDHEENAVDMARQMSDEGVVIHTIGIGSVQGASVPDLATGQLKQDVNGNIVVSRLNEQALESVAKAGKGTYQLFSGTDAVVNNVLTQLNTMDQRSVSDNSLMNYKSFFQFFLGFAFLILLIEIFISEKRKKIFVAKLKPAVTALLLLISSVAIAQEDKELVKKGNEAYKNKKYSEAIPIYSKAAEMNPSNQAAIYNLGSALYKNGDSLKAVKAYESAIKSAVHPEDKSNAYYNQGVVYQNSNRIAECIAAYKNALRINPNDEDARQNLQKALQKQKQDQKDKQDQGQSKNKDQSPKQQPSKLSKQDAENKLDALQQQEKNLHDKLKKVNANAVNKPEKDW